MDFGARRIRSTSVLGAIAIAAALAACTHTEPSPLRTLADRWGGDPLPTQASAVDAVHDPGSAPWYRDHKIAEGRRLLDEAIAADAAVRDTVAAHGRPAGVAAQNEGTRIVLYYVAADTAYVLEPTSAVAEEQPRRSLVETRAIRPDERQAIATGDQIAAARQQLDHFQTQMGRIAHVAYRVVAVLPAEEKPGFRYGFLAARPNALLLRGLGRGDAANAGGMVVTFVDSEGPAAAVLRRGDVIVEVNGMPVEKAQDYHLPRSERIELTVSRPDGEVVVPLAPARLPRPLDVYLLPSESLNAFSQPAAITVTGALERACDDDMLAFAIGHELAHVTAGDPELNLTSRSIATALLKLPFTPIFFVPIVGQAAANAAQGVDDRYNREQELGADRVGAGYASRAGFDPAGGVRLLELSRRITAMPSTVQFFEIHPAYPERLEALRRVDASAGS